MPLSSFTAGRRVRASELNAIIDQVNSLTAPAWTAYGTSATILTASTSNPTFGNSTFTARYRRPAGSDLIVASLTVTIGSTFAAGSGNYKWLVPQATTNAQNTAVGAFWINDFGTAFRAGSVVFADSTHVELHPHNGTGGPYGSGGPGTAWATGDQVKLEIEYEPV